jgi:hypothetical protein
MMIDDFKILLGIEDTTKDNLLNLLLSKATTKFQNYCNRSDIPDNAQSCIVDYAVILYNRQGSEGLQSESYSGVNNTYETGIPQAIKDEWNAFRKVQTL